MKNSLLYSMLAALFSLLAACGAVTPIPAPTATAVPTLTSPAALTATASATFTPYPLTPAAGLVMAIHEIRGQPETDSLRFTTLDGRTYTHAQMGSGSGFLSNNRIETMPESIWATLGHDKLVATENYNQDGSKGWVALAKNGREIYRLATGPGSPVSALRSLWVYDNHWVLEAALITQRKAADGIYTDATGQIVEDGVLLNQKYGYEEAFGFQTIDGKPFYFFKRNGKTDAWYDGQEIPLGFERIFHYGCCSAGQLNPLMLTNMVAFFGTRGEVWYLVQIGKPGTFSP